MIKRLVLISFLSLLMSNDTLENNIFNYSFKNTNPQTSIFSFKILRSNNNFTNYNITWSPTDNLFINTNFINKTISHQSNSFDNKLYYGVNISLLISNKTHSGFGVSTLKFDKNYNRIKWVDYFINREFNINNLFNIDFGVSYLYSNQISFLNLNLYFNKEIYKKINIGIGADTAISLSINKIYFGINYSL